MIQFLLNDQLIQIENERADLSLLEFVREQKGLTGTKEGCASGDCGACTLVVATLPTKPTADISSPVDLQYKAINSCVTFLPAVHGKQVITVEHLSEASTLHPVQAAMVEANASQCGFCTPGFVMSIFALYQQSATTNKTVNRAQVINALSGNLCRCTGYQPIINAALNACNQHRSSIKQDQNKAMLVLEHLRTIAGAIQKSSQHALLPDTREQLAACIKQHPEAHLVAGSTDLALLHTQQLQRLHTLISVSHVPELTKIEIDKDRLQIGAACTLSDIQPILLAHFPSLEEIMNRFASVPIRNQATLGGNIATASPIGDMPPILLALNAKVVLDNGENTRTVALKEFYLGYKHTVLRPNEWIQTIHIPLLSDQQILKVYKVSKRMEDDISAVCMAICLHLENGKVSGLGAGFGGVAATPAVCDALQACVLNKPWQHQSNIALGKQVLSEAFTPIDDVRATASYRQLMLQNLWHRFWLETNNDQHLIATRVVKHA